MAESAVLGVLLAGGQSRRMGGGDKCLMQLAGKSLLDHAIEFLRPQVSALALSANGDPARFADWSLPIISDDASLAKGPTDGERNGRSDAGYLGPLAGIAACLDWAAAQSPTWDLIATVPTDAPFLPNDLIARLVEARSQSRSDLARAVSLTIDGNRRAQPVIGLWPTELRHDLRAALADGVRKVDIWTAKHSLAEATFPTNRYDPFFNINRPEDLAIAEKIIRSL
jgi:molybdopterin-guanine dinucleotide biosynthesis protein A